jgi:hypothetical protein
MAEQLEQLIERIIDSRQKPSTERKQPIIRIEAEIEIDPEKEMEETPPEREEIKHIIVGSRKAINSAIKELQKAGYTSEEWSPILPTGNIGEVMVILTRYILAQ